MNIDEAIFFTSQAVWSGGWGVSVSPCLLNFRTFFFWLRGRKGKVSIGSLMVFLVEFAIFVCLVG